MRVRWNEHKSLANQGDKTHFHNAIRKYGVESFSIEILEEGWDPKIGQEIREPYWISTLKPEYNHTQGGEGQSIGYVPSEISKIKSSISHKISQAAITQRKKLHLSHVGIPRPESFIQKIKIAMKGNKNGATQDRSYMKTPEYRMAVSIGKKKHAKI